MNFLGEMFNTLVKRNEKNLTDPDLKNSFIVRDQIIRYYKNNNKKYKIITNNDSIENAAKVAKNIIKKCYV